MTPGFDDGAALVAADPQRLVSAYASLPGRLEAGYRAAFSGVGKPSGELRSVTFCAMGGSAAAGDVVASAFGDRLSVPIEVARGYELPAHCGPDALVVCASYSGTTEESVAAHREAVERGCPTVAICSGGDLARAAEERGTPLVRLPADAPQPRAALGSLAGAGIGALAATGVISGVDEDVREALDTLRAVALELGPESPAGPNEAKAVAEWIGEAIPLVWGWRGIGATAAWRWKTAFNENAKVPAFSAEFPELAHHEIVGWAGDAGRPFRLVVLRYEGEHASAEPRIAATLEEVARSGLEAREVWARGERPLSRLLSMMLVGDFASAYHALARGVDPAPIEAIARVKARIGGA